MLNRNQIKWFWLHKDDVVTSVFPPSSLQVLRQLQQGLAKCYSVAFEKSGAVSDAKITPHTLNFVKKLVSTFGVGLENVSNVSTMFSSAASESLARRAQATAQDPVFQKMKGQFTTGWFAFKIYLNLMLCVENNHTGQFKVQSEKRKDDSIHVWLLF